MSGHLLPAELDFQKSLFDFFFPPLFHFLFYFKKLVVGGVTKGVSPLENFQLFRMRIARLQLLLLQEINKCDHF